MNLNKFRGKPQAHHTCHTSSHIPPGAAFVFTGQERRYFGSAQRQRPHERRGGTQEEVELRTGERPPGDGPQPSLAWMFGMFGAWGKPMEAWGDIMDIIGLTGLTNNKWKLHWDESW